MCVGIIGATWSHSAVFLNHLPNRLFGFLFGFVLALKYNLIESTSPMLSSLFSLVNICFWRLSYRPFSASPNLCGPLINRIIASPHLRRLLPPYSIPSLTYLLYEYKKKESRIPIEVSPICETERQNVPDSRLIDDGNFQKSLEQKTLSAVFNQSRIFES